MYMYMHILHQELRAELSYKCMHGSHIRAYICSSLYRYFTRIKMVYM